MNITLRQLELFLKVIESGSISKAAEELHLTQPAVSIQLQNFQQHFRYPLLEIIHKKIYITDFGKEIAQSAGQVMDALQLFQEKSEGVTKNLSGKLKLAIASTGKYIMPYFLSDFLNQYPDVELIMDVTNKSRVISSLVNNEIDFALVSILPDTPKVKQIELLENKLYCVGNRPLAASVIRQGSLPQGTPFIFRESGSGTRQVMEKYFARNKFNIRKKLELTSNEAVKQAVLAGIGISIMPLIGIKNEVENGQLKIIPFKGLPITTQWRLIWLKEKKLSPVAQRYMDFLQGHRENILAKYFKAVR